MTTPSGHSVLYKIIVGLLLVVPGVVTLVLTLSLKPSVKRTSTFFAYESLPFFVSSLLACLLVLVASVCPPRFLGKGPRARVKAIIGLLYVVAFNALLFFFG
jgi:hypothetical protein